MIKTCTVCGKEFDGSNRSKYCSKECRNKSKSFNRNEKVCMDQYDNGYMADINAEAKKLGISYGHYQEHRYSKSVTVHNPHKAVAYKFRKQQFDEMVEQHLLEEKNE